MMQPRMAQGPFERLMAVAVTFRATFSVARAVVVATTHGVGVVHLLSPRDAVCVLPHQRGVVSCIEQVRFYIGFKYSQELVHRHGEVGVAHGPEIGHGASE